MSTFGASNGQLRGVVKWYNPTRGYGFIQPSDGSKDVFVHVAAVERAGWRTLSEGQTIYYKVVTTRGKTSAEELRLAPDSSTSNKCTCQCNCQCGCDHGDNSGADKSAPAPTPIPPPAPPAPTPRAPSTGELRGRVKWYNPAKGYGFIQPDDGGKDVFVLVSAVERAGRRTLNEGEVVYYIVVTARAKVSAENLRFN